MVVLAAPNVTEIEGSQKVEGVTLFGEKEVSVSLSFKVSESMLQNGVEYSTTNFSVCSQQQCAMSASQSSTILWTLQELELYYSAMPVSTMTW